MIELSLHYHKPKAYFFFCYDSGIYQATRIRNKNLNIVISEIWSSTSEPIRENPCVTTISLLNNRMINQLTTESLNV